MRHKADAERAACCPFRQVKNSLICTRSFKSLYINPTLFVEYYESFALRYKTKLDESAGEITRMDNTVLAYILMGIVNFIGLKYVFFDKGADLEKVADQAMAFYRYGLSGLGQPAEGPAGE